jgi:hypothetical protein
VLGFYCFIIIYIAKLAKFIARELVDAARSVARTGERIQKRSACGI